EYRIVFARRSGEEHVDQRLFINFEAVLPSPTGTQAGCEPMAKFWRSLSDEDPAVSADKLWRLYFEKDFLPPFSPILHIANYGGRSDRPTGQIRTNQHMEEPWVLGEFTIVKSDASPVHIKPVPVANTPFAYLMCGPKLLVTEQMVADFREALARAVT